METRYQAKENEIFHIALRTVVLGLTDVELEITKPDGSLEGTNLALSAATGRPKVYTGDYTPTQNGLYFLKVVSPTHIALDGKIFSMEVKPLSTTDTAGAGFVSATDSLKAISDIVQGISAAQSGGNEGFI